VLITETMAVELPKKEKAAPGMPGGRDDMM
jgi:hypothetical protein